MRAAERRLVSMVAARVEWAGSARVSSVRLAQARWSQHLQAPDRLAVPGRIADAGAPVAAEADVLVPLAESFVGTPFHRALVGSILPAFRDMADGFHGRSPQLDQLEAVS